MVVRSLVPSVLKMIVQKSDTNFVSWSLMIALGIP